jgi:hypothetical protein
MATAAAIQTMIEGRVTLPSLRVTRFVITGNPLTEQKISGSAPIADIREPLRHFRSLPLRLGCVNFRHHRHEPLQVPFLRSPCRPGIAHEFALLMRGDLSIAAERGGQACVAQVLRPGLHLPSQIAFAADRDDSPRARRADQEGSGDSWKARRAQDRRAVRHRSRHSAAD